MTDIPGTQATNGNPTYLGKGDPAGRFADYYPAWVDKLADDVTLEGSMLDGALQFLAGRLEPTWPRLHLPPAST